MYIQFFGKLKILLNQDKIQSGGPRALEPFFSTSRGRIKGKGLQHFKIDPVLKIASIFHGRQDPFAFGDDLFSVLFSFVVISLYVYQKTKSHCLKGGPVLQINLRIQ